MNKVKENLTDEDIDIIMSDVCRRLMYHPAMKEIDGDDVVRIDSIDTNRRMFHILNGGSYEWMSFKKYLPCLFKRKSMYNSVIVNDRFVDVNKKIRDVVGEDIDVFNTSDGVLIRITDNMERMDKILKVINILDMLFIDYNNLIENGLACNVLGMTKNPYK